MVGVQGFKFASCRFERLAMFVHTRAMRTQEVDDAEEEGGTTGIAMRFPWTADLILCC